MSTRTADPNELGAFLKARRAELTPRDVGLPEGGTPRRVPGLRREEVAQLASISTDYYTRLEQGRINASASVLAANAPGSTRRGPAAVRGRRCGRTCNDSSITSPTPLRWSSGATWTSSPGTRARRP